MENYPIEKSSAGVQEHCVGKSRFPCHIIRLSNQLRLSVSQSGMGGGKRLSCDRRTIKCRLLFNKNFNYAILNNYKNLSYAYRTYKEGTYN